MMGFLSSRAARSLVSWAGLEFGGHTRDNRWRSNVEGEILMVCCFAVVADLRANQSQIDQRSSNTIKTRVLTSIFLLSPLSRIGISVGPAQAYEPVMQGNPAGRAGSMRDRANGTYSCGSELSTDMTGRNKPRLGRACCVQLISDQA